MTDRVDLLEERVASLATAVAALEARLAGLESAPEAIARVREEQEGAEATGAVPEAGVAALSAVSDTAPMALVGRAFLGIGGAYLFRALTEAGTLPHLVGVALGLAYAGAWLLAAVWSGRSGRRTDAALHAFLSLAVALPLLWETTVRMRTLPPIAAAALLFGIGAATFAVAWRHDLASVAWAAALGAVGTAWGLLLATARIELFTLLLIAFGAATLWATYGRRWHGLRWPAALAADLAVLTLVYLGSRPSGPPESYAGLSPGRAVFIALLLFVVYAGSFAARTLARRRDVNVFEVFQTAAVLAVGYGGAVRLSQAAGTGGEVLGVAALVLSALGYAAAFGFVERDAGGARNFLFFSSLGLVLALTGGGVLAEGPALAFVWTGFGLTAAVLGVRLGRRTLTAHGAAYLATAGIPSGLFAPTFSAFAGSTAMAPLRPSVAAFAVAAAAAVSWGVTVRWRWRDPEGARVSIPATVLLAVAATGAGAGTIFALVAALPAGAVAPARTAVLAGAAVGLAALRKWIGADEAGWLAWTVFVGAALRVLLQDLPAGRPIPLFVGFVLCGAALLAVSSLGRRGGASSRYDSRS
ncbi:MAG TPA: hypothetical protein VE129_08930 [Thermoanaerobaculia bacterium]|nr:hypothetical protein [Thermoanaerobaculia bacterium]